MGAGVSGTPYIMELSVTLDTLIYWTGSIVLCVFLGIGLLILLYFLWLRFERLYREIFLWVKYDDFDDYHDFCAFRKHKNTIPKERLCPHCGGTGLIDNDDATRMELEELKKIAQKHPDRLAFFIKTLGK